MGEQPSANQPVHSLFAADVKGFERLAELALDLRWSWNHRADDIWEQLDPALWARTQNPWIVLQSVSRERLERALADSTFVQSVEDLLESSRRAIAAPAWFQTNHPRSPLSRVAYFSMEFMLGPALPIYSGGLGNVAGDQLKSASDLGVPVVGIGLLYQQGYFRQVIDRDGSQQALFPHNEPGQLPITPLRRPNGEWLRIEIVLPGRSMWLRAWQAQVGRVRLYLLDSNDAANMPTDRGITSELYGGGPDVRLMQEVVLGIGGWRLLAALGSPPEVCHLNEGHAALVVLERARHFMEATRQPFDVALAVTRAGNLFTTHTAVDSQLRSVHSVSGRAISGLVRQRRAPRGVGRSARARPRHAERSHRSVQHGVPRDARKRGSQRRQSIARRHQPRFVPAALSAMAGGGGAGRPRHERRPHAHMGLESG